MALQSFLICGRARIHDEEKDAKRLVYLSRLGRSAGDKRLEHFMADRAPLFYRSPDQIAEVLNAGYFRTAFQEAVRQLPTSDHFRDSHFGEILSAIFAEEIVGWRLIYSKLKMLTAENSNPYKMDLVFYDPKQRRPTFIFGEVKSSMKSEAPANHDKSCYPSLFDSLRDYSESDLIYDLTAARDNIEALAEEDRRKVYDALMPYAERTILYAGFSVIDTGTRSPTETPMLATRKSPKTFDIDLLCIDSLSEVSESTYTILDGMRHV